MAKLPIITHRRDIDVRVVYGQNIFELYQQIHNLIQRELPELANLFAEPLVNAVRGEISWTTKASGSIKAGTTLSYSDWSSLGSRLKNDLGLILGLIEKLEKTGRSNSAGTEALRCMLVTPNLRGSVFQVGNEVVITQWGCYEFGSDVRNADLFEQIDAAPRVSKEPQTPSTLAVSTEAPLHVDPPTPPLQPIESSPPPADPPAPSFGNSQQPLLEPPTAPETEKSLMWRWLLLALLILLLLIGLLAKYWQTHHQAGDAALQAEIAQLTAKLDKKISDCVIQTSSIDSGAAMTPPISNSDFSSRQADNQIRTDSNVNVSLAWNDRSDLDLWVFQPDGEVVFHGPCTGANCGQLDVDANRCDMSGPICTSLTDRPLENISWPHNMLPGRYIVAVALYSINRPLSEAQSVRFTVQIRKNGVISTYEGLIRADEIQCKDNLCGTAPRRITQFNVE